MDILVTSLRVVDQAEYISRRPTALTAFRSLCSSSFALDILLQLASTLSSVGTGQLCCTTLGFWYLDLLTCSDSAEHLNLLSTTSSSSFLFKCGRAQNLLSATSTSSYLFPVHCIPQMLDNDPRGWNPRSSEQSPPGNLISSHEPAQPVESLTRPKE